MTQVFENKERKKESKGDSRDTRTFVTNCPIGMFFPVIFHVKNVSLHFTRSGFLMPTAAGVVVEKGSEYILAHTGPRELDSDGHPLGGCGSGVCFRSWLYCAFDMGPDQCLLQNNIHVSEVHCESAVRFGQALLGFLITAHHVYASLL